MLEFVNLNETYLADVLRWRTSPEITKYMATDVENDLVQHKKWFKKNSKYWIIKKKSAPVGIIAIIDINWIHNQTTWSYYIGEEKVRAEIGGIVPLYLYNLVFNDLKLNKILTDVIVENVKVIKLHKFHGHREVGIFKKHYRKNGIYFDVQYMELLADDWKRMNDRFGHYQTHFQDWMKLMEVK